MRRICCILLVTALAAPAAALAVSRASGAAGDGSLVVADASGTIVIQGKGLVFGHFDQGALIVLDFRPDDPDDSLTVSGAKTKVSRAGATYTGSDVRFLFPSGRYRIELLGVGISVSAVGKGTVSATGAGTGDDGTFATNGGKVQPLPKAAAVTWFGVKAV